MHNKAQLSKAKQHNEKSKARLGKLGNANQSEAKLSNAKQS